MRRFEITVIAHGELFKHVIRAKDMTAAKGMATNAHPGCHLAGRDPAEVRRVYFERLAEGYAVPNKWLERRGAK